MVTGTNRALADKHPKGIRGSKDGAKLISYKKREDSGFIYLGRFLDAQQAAGVGREVTMKAHAALQWLVKRQGYSTGGADPQVFVAWAMKGTRIPDPWSDTEALIGDDIGIGDAGQGFAQRLRCAIAGYKANLDDTEDIVVMGMDSATPGRMATTFYRKLAASEFLDRILAWHENNSWPRKLGERLFPCAPAPKEIAWAAFGRRVRRVKGKGGAKLEKATIARLVACVVDAQPVPRDLVVGCGRRASHRLGFERDIKKGDEKAWEQCLSTACALFRGSNQERRYEMSLEEDRKTRDYLFGRLLAVAEHIEDTALWIADEKRDTTAAKLMHRFSDRPSSTWLTIEKSLAPYHSRVRAKWPGYQSKLKDLLDRIASDFRHNDFVDDSRLGGEFLLGYHCQRQKLRERSESSNDTEPSTK